MLSRFKTGISAFVLLSILSGVPAPSADKPATGKVTTPSAPAAILVGFMGGFVGRNDAIHNEVQLAKRLGAAYPSILQVRMFENRHGSQALHEILRLLDRDGNGSLSTEEKRDARIAIFGHSWGGSETVTLARALAGDGVPVLLTVQVDSVQKPGEDDARIPANVLQAVNFYQSAGLIRGRSKILAVDASRTEILGNFRSDYKSRQVSCEGYPWYARVFMRPHIEIESDPAVWGQVETLIRAKLSLSPRRE